MTIEEVLVLHEIMIQRTGGSAGVRDLGLIESALARGEAAFGGVEAYPDQIGKAAAIGSGLVQNHGFIDGNKRVGIAVLLLLLQDEGIKLQYSQEELSDLGFHIAADHWSVEQVIAWIHEHKA